MESNFTPSRSRLNLSSATSLLEEHKKSGLTFKAFCRAKNIPFSRLNYWRDRIRKSSSEGVTFVPLPMATNTATTPYPTHVEFMFPGGISLRVPADIDKACLVSLMQAAREAT